VHEYWFRARPRWPFGYWVYPICWQGWLFAIIVIAASFGLLFAISVLPTSLENTGGMFAFLYAVVVGLFLIGKTDFGAKSSN